MENKPMKKNKSVPNLRTSKQNNQNVSLSHETTHKGLSLKNIFGIKNKETKTAATTPEDKSQKETFTPSKATSYRNLNKLMSEPVGVLFEEDNNKHQSIFKKFSLRLSGSKKDKQKLKSKGNCDIIRDINSSSQPNLERDIISQENKEHVYEDFDGSLNSTGFVRQRKAQMSMRKAFGIFDDCDSSGAVIHANNTFEKRDDGYMKQLHELFIKEDNKLNFDTAMEISTFANHPSSEITIDEKDMNVRLSLNLTPTEASDTSFKNSDNKSHSYLQRSCKVLLEEIDNLEYDSTLKPDLYANQLREQARRLSLSKSSSNSFNKKQNRAIHNSRGETRISGKIQFENEMFQQNFSKVKEYEDFHLDDCQGRIQNEILSPGLNSNLVEIARGTCHKPIHSSNVFSIEDRSPMYKQSSAYNNESQINYVYEVQKLNRQDTSMNIIDSVPESLNSNSLMGYDLEVRDDIDKIPASYGYTHVSKEMHNDAHDEFFQISEQLPPKKSLLINQKSVPVKFTSDLKSSHNTNKSNRNASESTQPSRIRRKRQPEIAKEFHKTNNDANINNSKFGLSNGNVEIDDSKFAPLSNEKKLKKPPRMETDKNSKSSEGSDSRKNLTRRMSVEKRGKLLEEKECEEFAMTLADKLKLVDPHLSNILSTKHKSILDHMPSLTNVCYCPDEIGDSLPITELRTKSHAKVSKPKVKDYSVSVEQEKDEMENMLVKKIDVLCREKDSLERKIVLNNESGKEVCKSLPDHLDPRQVEKFVSLTQEAEKVMKLILKLSNMLARAEESYHNLPHNSTDKEKAILHNKTESLKSRLNEAKLIKENVDSKYEQIISIFHVQLPSSVTKNFDVFLSIKNLLMIDLEELGNEICLSQTQLHSLRSTMNKNSVGTTC